MEKTAIKLANTEGPVEDPVVEICLATANMLNQTVLVAIIEEDAEDRVELQNGLDAFLEHEEKRQDAQDAIDAAERAVEQAANSLVDCRREESEVCTEVEHCHDIIHSGVCNEVTECWLCEHCTDLAVMEGTASLCCIDQKNSPQMVRGRRFRRYNPRGRRMAVGHQNPLRALQRQGSFMQK